MTKVTPKRGKKPQKKRKKRVEMNDERRARALELLEEGEFVVDIAQAINVHRQTLFRERKRNKAFGEKWKEAEAIGREIQANLTEQEMDFRGRIGWIEPVFYEGKVCGYKQKFSDALLMARMKALDPERYGDKTKHEHSGKVDTGIVVLPQPASDDDQWHADHSKP